ncbi:flagellar hook-length control protein FliK [Salinicola avicenniae]|uniref:flagellar hook-length control protein FliK n=1 Tax=Salinicola avicenniae TaxID=2916836 RepID=UPI00207345A6|nr:MULTISPECIES: flagellar hook-length control protein FliK [unclassified Salinicola]
MSDSQDDLLDARLAETSLPEDIDALQQWLDSLPQNSPLKNFDAETLAKADDGSDLPADALAALAALALFNSPQAASASGKTPAISTDGSPARGANSVLATTQAMPTLLKDTAQASIEGDSEPFPRLDASLSGNRGLQSRQEATTTPSLLETLAAKSGQDTATSKGASSLAAAVTEATAKLAGNTSTTTGDGAAFRDLIGGHAEQVSATPNSAPAVQPTALGLTATTATSTAAPGASIPVAVNSPQWPASFGQQILQMHQRGDQQVSLHLNPRDLGPLNVSLSVQDQQAQLQILSAHAPVRAAIEAAIPQLREALAQSGIALGEAMVGDQGQFQQQDQSGDQPRFAGGDGLGSGIGTSVGDETVTARQIPLVDNGNINLYA